jgi:class 3 adenylate cyclase
MKLFLLMANSIQILGHAPGELEAKMAKNWDHQRAKEHIELKLEEVNEVEVVDYSREMSLENIPSHKAYRMNAAHMYVDILNLDEILNSTESEGETSHKRALRFLNQHYRAVRRILAECGVVRVDFHNERLHAVVTKPYGDAAEADRIRYAVAVGKLIADVLKETGDSDQKILPAVVRVGIDSGLALAVNNGRNGGREPLFLGEPANLAAKLCAGTKPGIYLANNARTSIGLEQTDYPKSTSLDSAEIQACEEEAELPVSKDSIVKAWDADMEANPIGAFEFSGHTPPMRRLDISKLTPGNSRRQEVVSIYADVDGFSNYVRTHIASNPEDVVRVFHVVRAELDRTLTEDFEGRRIRFIGDCIHGVICEGTAHNTDVHATISSATLCTGALRSGFDLALQILDDDGIAVDDLGLAIGFEYGPIAISRLGMQGDRVRCAVSRCVIASETEQMRCTGAQTAIGPAAFAKGPASVRAVFGDTRKGSDLDFNEVVEAMSAYDDEQAKSAKKAAFAVSPPAVRVVVETNVRPHSRLADD